MRIDSRFTVYDSPTRASRGFTLIELLVVVSIIGLITTVITVSSSASRTQARDLKRKSDAASVAAAIEVYYSEKRSYPGATAPLITQFTGSWDALKTQLYPTYTSEWPADPKGPDGTFGSGFVYQVNPADKPTVGTKAGSYYVIDVTLEGDEEVSNPSINCQDPAQLAFYTSGTVKCTDGKVHYRIAPR